MNRILIPFAVLILMVTRAQSQSFPSFVLTKDGVEPIVINVDSTTATDLYKKSLNWVQETYKNSSKVLMLNIPNEKIRIDGYQPGALTWNPGLMKMHTDMEYSFEVEFKDNRMRLSFTPGQFYEKPGHRAPFGVKHLFKDNGEERGQYKGAKASMDELMNSLAQSLYLYNKAKKQDW